MAAPRQNKLFGPAKMSKLKKRKSDPGGGADQDWEKGYVPKSKQGQLQAEKEMDEKVLRQSDPELEDLKKLDRKLTPMERYHQKRMKKLGL